MKKKPQWGEVWIVDYTLEHPAKQGRNFEIESQIKKIRPSVVISNNIWNSFEESVLVVPFTSETGFTRVPFEVKLEASAQNGLDTDSKILLGEVRPVNVEFRLRKLIGKLQEKEMRKILSGISFLMNNKNI